MPQLPRRLRRAAARARRPPGQGRGRPRIAAQSWAALPDRDRDDRSCLPPEPPDIPLRRLGPRGSGTWNRISLGRGARRDRRPAARHPREIRSGSDRARYRYRSPPHTMGIAICSRARHAELVRARFCPVLSSASQHLHADVRRLSRVSTSAGRSRRDAFSLGTQSQSTPVPTARPASTCSKLLLTIRRSSSSIPGAPGSPRRPTVWLQVRPGTDDALALSMLNVIIGERLYDEPFVAPMDPRFRCAGRTTSRRIRRNGRSRSPGCPQTRSGRQRDCSRDQARACSSGAARSSTRPNASRPSGRCRCCRRLRANIDVPGGWVFGMHGIGRFPSLIENLTPGGECQAARGGSLQAARRRRRRPARRAHPDAASGHARRRALSGQGISRLRQQHADDVCEHRAGLRIADEARFHGLRRPVHDADRGTRRHRAAGGLLAGARPDSPDCRPSPPMSCSPSRRRCRSASAGGRRDLRRTGATDEAPRRYRIGRRGAQCAACRGRPRRDLRGIEAARVSSRFQSSTANTRTADSTRRPARSSSIQPASRKSATRRCRITRSRRKARSARPEIAVDYPLVLTTGARIPVLLQFGAPPDRKAAQGASRSDRRHPSGHGGALRHRRSATGCGSRRGAVASVRGRG